jgi:glutamyl-tRNA synthetase
MADTNRPVRVRFAPSPTGYLHIGGVRSALFNWLFARHHDGKFVLRVDDTDRERNLEDALRPILEGLRWLGLQWDEGPEVGGEFGPYFQSERTEIYNQAVDKLLKSGYAYYDYATPDEVQTERAKAQATGRRFVYSRKFMAETVDDRKRFEAEGREVSVRLKMPRQGVCRFTDRIRGEVEVDWALEQDHVIRRTDGSVLYHLASVVDDQAMQISHVIRAEEHLSNTPRQIWIFEGLGSEPPEFAHLPFVAEPGSKSKLSKRKLDKYLKMQDFAHLYERGRRIAEYLGMQIDDEIFNPVIVDFYRAIGYLPEALVNYMLLLGWSLDDHTEFLSREAMIEHFSLERVNNSVASFDPKKLESFQAHYMQQLSTEEKLELVLPFLERAGWIESPADEAVRAKVHAIVEAAGDRIEVAGDILDYDEFFVADEVLEYDEKAFAKRLVKPEEAPELLAAMRETLAGLDSFDAASTEKAFVDFVEARGIKLGQIIHAVRVAVTGKAVGFGMFDILAVLGREHVLARIDRALELRHEL